MKNDEVNRIIAEKLFGWSNFRLGDAEDRPQIGNSPGQEGWRVVPDYCSNSFLVFDPGGVVDKMREKGYEGEVSWFLDEPAFVASFTKDMDGQEHDYGSSALITEAVARAAANALKEGM